MTEIAYCLNSQPKVPLQHWGINLWPKISERFLWSRNFEGLPNFSWQSSAAAYFCDLLIQFGQYNVTSWGKGSFFAQWLTLPQIKVDSIWMFYWYMSYSFVMNWCCQENWSSHCHKKVYVNKTLKCHVL